MNWIIQLYWKLAIGEQNPVSTNESEKGRQ